MLFNGTMLFMDLSGLIAFGSGILSFFSPCVLPLLPSYLIFISGISVDNYNDILSSKYRKIVFIHSIAFVLGFSFVFVTMGFSSSFVGKLLSSYQDYIIKAGGLILILMGLFYLNIIKIPLLNREKIIQLKEKPIGLAGSFIVGITFSLGWTPCIGPALSSILIIASASENILKGVYLLGLYSLGMAIPFLISSLLCNKLLEYLRRYGHIVKYSMKILGTLLIIVGLLLITSYFGKLSLMLGLMLSF